MSWGIALLLLGVASGLAGTTAWNFRIALALNGVGWNFLFVGDDDAGDHLLPPQRAGQGAGARRLPGLRDHGDRELRGRPPAGAPGRSEQRRVGKERRSL